MLQTEPSPPATATVLPSIDQSRPYTPLGIVAEADRAVRLAIKGTARWRRCARRDQPRAGSFENWQA